MLCYHLVNSDLVSARSFEVSKDEYVRTDDPPTGPFAGWALPSCGGSSGTTIDKCHGRRNVGDATFLF